MSLREEFASERVKISKQGYHLSQNPLFIANGNPVLWLGSQVMAPPLVSVPYGGLLKGRQGRSGALWKGSAALKRFTGQPPKDIAIDTVVLPACAGPAVTG